MDTSEKNKYHKYHKYVKKCNSLLQVGGNGESSDESDLSHGNEIPLIKKINLELTKKEKKIIKNINITDDDNYSVHFYYSNENEMLKIISDFIKTIGDNSSKVEEISKIILKIIKNAVDYESQESAIIDIRVAVNETSEFRWHRDGRHIKFSEKKPVYKFVTTLKGESTPIVVDEKSIEKFNVVDEDQRELNNCVETYLRKYNIEPSVSLWKELWKINSPQLIDAIGKNYIQAKTLDEGIFFLTMKDGTDDATGKYGAIHSEPKIQKERLFIAVLPGPLDKCKEYVSRRKDKNPQFNK